jgi:hypothetical protein
MIGASKANRETQMNARYGQSTWASLALALGLLGAAPGSWAVETFTATTGAEKPAKGQKSKPAKAAKAPSDKGSAEGRAERDQRLLRECRGRPNAGACEGYAR